MSVSDKPVPPPAAPLAPTTMLQNPTDRAVRPGFRSPPNAGSKAQKAQKGKGKKK